MSALSAMGIRGHRRQGIADSVRITADGRRIIMFRKLGIAGSVVAVTLGALVASQPARAEDPKVLRINVGLPPTHTWVTAYTYFAKELPAATNNTMKAEEYYGTLLNFRETVPGIRDGVADVGLAVVAYFPAEFRETNIVGELGMLGEDGITMSGAVSEYIFNCEPCLAEFERFNQVYLGTTASPVYRLFSTMPVTTLDNLKGLKIRSGAGVYTRWAEHFGASPSTLSATEVYEGLSQGVINANLHPTTELINLNLSEVAKYVTELPLGTFNAVSVYSMNRDVWNELTDEQRAGILDLTARGNAHVAVQYEMANRAAKDAAIAKGVTFVQPDEALLAATRDFAANDALSAATAMEATYGVKDAEAKVKTFMDLSKKWAELTKDVKVDEAAFAELMKREIWSKLDAKTYARAN